MLLKPDTNTLLCSMEKSVGLTTGMEALAKPVMLIAIRDVGQIWVCTVVVIGGTVFIKSKQMILNQHQ